MTAQKYTRQWAEKQKNPKFVFFWKKGDKDGEFGQFYPATFVASPIYGNIGPRVFVHNEQWMMANKALLFGDNDAFEKIMAEENPQVCQNLGKAVRNFDQQTWNDKKYFIVRTGNGYKFNQNPALNAKLKKYIGYVFVEASPKDVVWGIGLSENHPDARRPAQWQGENLLGFALMEVLDMILKQEE